MSAPSLPPLLESLAESVAACLDSASLRAMAALELDPRTRERLDELAEKANEGSLGAEERLEYQAFIGASEFLGLAQLRGPCAIGHAHGVVTREDLRQLVRERALRRCEYCHLPDVLPQTLRFHMEHVVARQHGGLTTKENLAWACHRCNERKGPNLSAVDPDTSGLVRLFHPRQDKWEEHFAPSGFTITGLTARGRATVWLLEMNSEERLRWRAALRRYGLF